jgi:hypothetical protein
MMTGVVGALGSGRWFAALVASAGLASAGWAQAQPGLPLATKPDSTVVEVPDDGSGIDLNFRGGTVGDYVMLIEKQAPGVLNFVMANEIADTEMLPLTLRAVSTSDAVAMVTRMARPKGRLGLRVEERVARGSRTFLIEEDRTRMPFPSHLASSPESVNRVTRVFSLNNLIGKALPAGETPGASAGGTVAMTSDVVLASLEQALSIASSEDPPAEVRFHSDSGLVFVRSTHDQAEIAERTIGTLQADFARPQRSNLDERRPRRFRPTRVAAAELVDAIRVVYPTGMENGPEIEAAEGIVGVTASNRVLMGIEALAAYLDAPRAPSQSEMEARREAFQLRERLEQAQRGAVQGEQQVAHLADQVRASRIAAELTQAKLAEAGNLMERLEERTVEVARVREELARARERVVELERAASGKTPSQTPPKEEPR